MNFTDDERSLLWRVLSVFVRAAKEEARDETLRPGGPRCFPLHRIKLQRDIARDILTKLQGNGPQAPQSEG